MLLTIRRIVLVIVMGVAAPFVLVVAGGVGSPSECERSDERKGCYLEIEMDDFVTAQGVHELTISPDGRYFAVNGWDHAAEPHPDARFRPAFLRVHRTDDGELVQSLPLYDGVEQTLNIGRNIVFSSEGNTIGAVTLPLPGEAAKEDIMVRVWQITDGALLHTISAAQMDIADRPIIYDLSSDGDTALVGGWLDSELIVYTVDLVTGEKQSSDEVPVPDDFTALAALSPDGSMAATTVDDGILLESESKTVATLETDINADMLFSPDGHFLLVRELDNVARDMQLEVWDIDARQIIWTFTEPASENPVVWRWLPSDAVLVRLITGEPTTVQFFQITE